VIPDAPQLGLPGVLAEAQAFHFQGVRRPARGERAAATGLAEQDAPAYLAAETARLDEVRQQLAAEAEQWWQALISNDEDTVWEAVKRSAPSRRACCPRTSHYGQDTRHALRWSCFRRRHQATAMRCHYKRRTAGHGLPPHDGCQLSMLRNQPLTSGNSELQLEC
jgi:hypothetical protein